MPARIIHEKWFLLGAAVLFFCFKLLFPNPDVFSDSLGYLDAGLQHLKISYRPLGYSHFLMLFNGMSNNYITLVWVQFAVFLAGSWYFNKTIFEVFRIRPRWQWLFWVLSIYNPLGFFLANLISSDCLFISLSMVWMGSLVRLVATDKKLYLHAGLHLFCMAAVFMLRYNGLYYPFISAVGIALSRKPVAVRLLVPLMALLITGYLYNSECKRAEEEVGINELSAFGGWALANNVCNVYEHVKIDEQIFDDPDQKLLHQYITVLKDSMVDRGNLPGGLTDSYIWSKKGPLKNFLFYKLMHREYNKYLMGWWNVAPTFHDFSMTVIKNYPGAFVRYFFVPNFLAMAKPAPEMLSTYGSAHMSLSPAFKDYFGYKKDYFEAPHPQLQGTITQVIQYVYYIPNWLTFFAGVAGIFVTIRRVVKKGIRQLPEVYYGLFMLSSFFVATILLLSFVHPLMLRYTSIGIIFFTLLPLLLLIVIHPRVRHTFSELPVEATGA